MINRKNDFWETSSPEIDSKIEDLAKDFEDMKMSSRKFLRMCAHIKFNYPDAISEKTLVKIFDFVLYVTNEEVDRVTDLYDKYYVFTYEKLID